jgi:hypothetical protein
VTDFAAPSPATPANAATHPAPVALGLATLCVFPFLAPIFAGNNGVIYHFSGKASSVLIPLVLLLAIAWLILFGLLTLIKRSPSTHRIGWTVLLAFLPWIVMKAAWSLSSRLLALPILSHRVSTALLFAGCLALLFGLGCSLWKPSFANRIDAIRNFTATLLSFFALVGLLIFVQLGWLTWKTRNLNQPQPPHHSAGLGCGSSARDSQDFGCPIHAALPHEWAFGRSTNRTPPPATANSEPSSPNKPDRFASRRPTHAIKPHEWGTQSVENPAPETATPHHRILWLVLDELAYRQLYEHRSLDLALPAFDRLAAQSTIFTHVLPAGLATEYVLPSLISGTPAVAVRASIDGQKLYLLDPASLGSKQQTWHLFDPHQTVFQDAIDRGYRTGVAGWYNPYCRILPGVLDRCFWVNHDPLQGGLSTDHSIAENLAMPLRRLWTYATYYLALGSHPTGGRTLEIEAHIRNYQDLANAADSLLDDPSLDFLYLHLPIPHPGGIYDRHTRQLTTGPATYLDNLALADEYLAHLRSKLEQRGEWDSTTLLLMGDHSWRTTVSAAWVSQAGWSPEEQAASDGAKFDDRPAYLLKLPNQQTPARIDAPFAALRTRALLDALMSGQIQSPEALATWANALKITK